MLLRSLGSFATLRVATLLRSLVWVGVGGHVNVPRTSYRIYCHVSVGWGLGWGGVGGHVNVPCTSYRIYCDVAKISGIFYYVTCCYAAGISEIDSYVTCCYAAGISEIVSYVTCCYAAEILGTFLLRYRLLRC